MQIADTAKSPFGLQRWVAYVTCVGALAIAVVNYFALRRFYGQVPAHALFNPTVLWLSAFAVSIFLTGVFDNTIARASQVVAFAVGGIVTALSTSQGDLTSAVFVIFSMLLLNEYTSQRSTVLVASIVALVYIVTIAIGIDDRTASVVLSLINTMILATAVIVLFALISYRQYLIRKEHESKLEWLVAERTSELQEALAQRDTMLQEIHHRVGNSLQLLASFVSLQQGEVDDAHRQVLKETELRVHAIADVHATLYSHQRLAYLPLRDYANELISDMKIAYRGDAEIEARVDVEMDAHIDFAISFGIVLNELITNATKHATNGSSRPRMRVDLSEVDTELVLLVRDLGPGFSRSSHKGVGTEVVDQLVSQNQGQITRKTVDGALVTVRFPLSSVLRRDQLPPGEAHSA